MTIRLSFEDQVPLQLVLGSVGGQTMEELQRAAGVTLHVRGGDVTIEGDDAAAALVERLLRQMVAMARAGIPIHPGDLPRALEVMRSEPRVDLRSLFDDTITPEAYAAAGLPQDTWEKVRTSTAWRSARAASTQPVLDALVEAGALDSRSLPRAWRELCAAPDIAR